MLILDISFPAYEACVRAGTVTDTWSAATAFTCVCMFGEHAHTDAHRGTSEYPCVKDKGRCWTSSSVTGHFIC